MSGTTPRRSGPGGGALTKSSVGSESAPHFNMYLWSWVRALTEAKEKGMGHAPIACGWDHPSSEWARGWGPYSRGRSTMKRLPTTQYVLHLLHPEGRYLHSRGLRPAGRKVVMGYTWSSQWGLCSLDRMYFDLLGCSSP